MSNDINIGDRVEAKGREGFVEEISRGWFSIEEQDTGEIFKARAKEIQVLDSEADEETEEEESGKMSKTLQKYRGAYARSVAYSGRPSMNTADSVAMMLEGLSPEEVCQLADVIMDVEPGFHEEKYAHLNKGQTRMNCGNRIRAAVRRGDVDPDTIKGHAATALERRRAAEALAREQEAPQDGEGIEEQANEEAPQEAS